MRLPDTIPVPEHVEGLTPSRIDPTNMGLAMQFFTAVYSRPRDAVLRELAANGLDAQRAAGVDAPVQITLPTAENPTVIVSDRGVGMSEKLMTEVYADYLESTKRQDPDDIGGYGVGGKTPAAVSNQYVVTSTRDGHEVSMLMATQPDGTTGHKIISRRTTDEPSGTTVSIPLPDGDAEKWLDAAKRVFYWWDRGTVAVDGRVLPTFHEHISADDSTSQVLFTRRGHRGIIVRINGVGYEAPRIMTAGARGDHVGLVIEARGDDPLTISRSRETLDDTDAGRSWLALVLKAWMTTLQRRARSRIAAASTSTEIATAWARVHAHLRYEVTGYFELRKLLEERGLPVDLGGTATVYANGQRNRLSDAKLLNTGRTGYRGYNVHGYLQIARGLFITPTEFTDEVQKIIGRWRNAPGRSTTLTVVDPDVPGFSQFVDPDKITWITGGEIIEQTPEPPKRVRYETQFSIERLELRGWYGRRRGRGIGLEDVKALVREGKNLVVGSRDEIMSVLPALDPATDVALLRGNRSLDRLAELLDTVVYTPAQITAKHADEGLYEMSRAQRQAVADLRSLQLSHSTRRSISSVAADPELSAQARKLLKPWAKHLDGPQTNQRLDYESASLLPEAGVAAKYPLTARMLQATDTIDVQVLNALVELDRRA